MASIKAKLKKMAETPEALASDRVWKRIESKLNYDGRYSLLNPAESMLRFGRLTNEESEYLGRVMGWDIPYHKDVDWEAVPSVFLAECVMREDSGIRALQYVYPAPDKAPVFEAASPEEVEDFLHGDVTFAELQVRYPTSSHGHQGKTSNE